MRLAIGTIYRLSIDPWINSSVGSYSTATLHVRLEEARENYVYSDGIVHELTRV